jgi:hypothetical protein
MSMIERFQVSRWSDTRKTIHALGPNNKVRFPSSEYFNALASASRLSDAYGGERKWTCSRNSKNVVVERIS